MVLAVLAIVIATVVAVYDREGSSTAGGTSDAATLELSEFALDAGGAVGLRGGTVEVTNTGSVAHNLAVSGTDVATADLAAGESETLDLSSLEPGEYEIICTVAGHADAGMTGALTITSTNPAPGSGTATSSTTSSATPGCTGWSPRRS